MNDRELLALAAKVAGYKPCMWTDGDEPYSGGSGWIINDRLWNPLTDDGDALRLAVQMAYIDVSRHILSAWQESDTGEGRRAYVRHAIVRAAAEIGRAMK